MLLFLLSKRKPCSIPLQFLAANRTTQHQFCSASTIPQNSDPNFSLRDYLIASFGFSPDKAARVSKSIAHLKSPEKPNAICSFLECQGLTKADIKTLISQDPRILCSSPENRLQPNFHALRTVGLSIPTLTKILLRCPQALQLHLATHRIKFWRDFFGGDEADLVKVFTRNGSLVTIDIDKNIQPKISFFQSHGLSIHEIRRIVLTCPRLITISLSRIEDALKRAKEMGFQPESAMFMNGLQAMACVNRDVLQKKAELLKGFGWSENDFFSALRRAPRWILFTEEKLQAKMEFLTGETRCDPSYIASYPLLLSLSLEKRLRPRQYVLHLLESRGLSSKRQDYWNVMNLTDINFVERYILPNKEKISGLQKAYLAACGREQNVYCES